MGGISWNKTFWGYGYDNGDNNHKSPLKYLMLFGWLQRDTKTSWLDLTFTYYCLRNVSQVICVKRGHHKACCEDTWRANSLKLKEKPRASQSKTCPLRLHYDHFKACEEKNNILFQFGFCYAYTACIQTRTHTSASTTMTITRDPRCQGWQYFTLTAAVCL